MGIPLVYKVDPPVSHGSPTDFPWSGGKWVARKYPIGLPWDTQEMLLQGARKHP